MIKTRGERERANVTFTLDRGVNASSASVCGDFNGWSGSVMDRVADGSFRATLEMEVGRKYRFRYLLDGNRWENDWAADEYVPNEFGGDDSVVDLTGLAEPVPSAGTSQVSEAAPALPQKKPTPQKTATPQKKAPATKASADKAPVKKAPVKKAAAAVKKAGSEKAAAPAKKPAVKKAPKKSGS